jgi:hypothetical protein
MDMGRGRYSTARVVHRLARTGLVSVLADPSSDAPAAPPVVTQTETRTDTPEPPAHETIRDLGRDDGNDDDDEDLSGDVWSGVQSPVTVPDRGDSTSGGELSTTAWSLPRRQPVALHEEPVRRPERRTPWPPSEDVETDDPKTEGGIPGLEAIGGFRDAMADDGGSAWTSGSDPTTHPNAAWLESLYSQYMDEPELPAKKRKKEMLDVAFGAEDQDAPVKLPTLRRLLDAIKKL